jgi:hypothetical protein
VEALHRPYERVADKLAVGGGGEAEIIQGCAGGADEAFGAGVGGTDVAVEEVGGPALVVVEGAGR